MSKTYKIKPADGKLKIDLPANDYLIQQEEGAGGVITVVCSPTDQVKKEFQSQLQSVQGEIAILQGQKDDLTAKIAALKQEVKDLEKIIQDLG